MSSLVMFACANNPNLRKTQVLSIREEELLPPAQKLPTAAKITNTYRAMLASEERDVPPEEEVTSIEQNPLPNVDAEQIQQVVKLVLPEEAISAGKGSETKANQDKVDVQEVELAEEKGPDEQNEGGRSNGRGRARSLLEKDEATKENNCAHPYKEQIRGQ